jgi:hypothetical protein
VHLSFDLFVSLTEAIWWPAAPSQPVTLAARPDARQTGGGLVDVPGEGRRVATGDARGAGRGVGVTDIASCDRAATDPVATGPGDVDGAVWLPHAATPTARARPSTTPRIINLRLDCWRLCDVRRVAPVMREGPPGGYEPS